MTENVITVEVVYFGIPENPHFKPMNLWERLWNGRLYVSSRTCEICGRQPQIVDWFEVGRGRVICDRCYETNEDFYECRQHWAQELWDEKCLQ